MLPPAPPPRRRGLQRVPGGLQPVDVAPVVGPVVAVPVEVPVETPVEAPVDGTVEIPVVYDPEPTVDAEVAVADDDFDYFLDGDESDFVDAGVVSDSAGESFLAPDPVAADDAAEIPCVAHVEASGFDEDLYLEQDDPSDFGPSEGVSEVPGAGPAVVAVQEIPEERVARHEVREMAPVGGIKTPAGNYPYGVVSHSYEGERIFTVDDGSALTNSPARLYGGKKFRRDRKKAGSAAEALRTQPRDIFWLEQAARYDFLSAEEFAGFARVYSRLPRKDVEMWAKSSPYAVQNRLRQLVRAGMLDAYAVPSGLSEAIVYRPSARALKVYGAAAFTPRKPSTEELMHTSAVARLGLLFESQDLLRERYYVMAEGEIRAFAKFGEATFVERGTEHWAAGEVPDLSNRAAFLVEKPGGFIYDHDGAGRPIVKGGFFRPDLVLLGRDGSRIAVEVERTPKASTSVYQDKFSGYLRSGFSGVQYVCFSRSVADAVRRGVDATPGAERLVAVDLFPDSLMPLPVQRVQRVTAGKFPGVKRGRGRPKTGEVTWVPGEMPEGDDDE